MTYRDDVDALFARVQALQAEVDRLREADSRAAARTPGRTDERVLATSQPRTTSWIGPLVARLPAAEQDLIADLVSLLTTRREYPALDEVSVEALDKLIARLRATFKKA